MIQFLVGMVAGIGIGLVVMALMTRNAYERGAEDAIENLAKRRRSS